MNAARLKRSVRLLRAANALRAKSYKSGDDEAAARLALEKLEQHDADARARVDPRQLSIFDALTSRGK